MKGKAFATLLVLLAGLCGSSWAIADDAASVVRGGRLYDNFILETKGRAPNHPHPLFKTKLVRIAPADTWRCVSCHGWDYKGSNGFIGVVGRQKTDPAAIVAILKDANHPYEELLDEGDRVDLAAFIVGGQMDMPKLLEASRRIKPVAGTADKVFATVCANCHGIDGDRLRQVPPLGDSARAHPFEVLHTIVNGHPGGDMPALRTLGEDAVAKMLASLQTLPSINLAASIANGGRLFDNWQVNSGGQSQALPHPSYPPKAYFASAPAETWRCKECHGWDYKGNQGRNATGIHATGIKGIRAMAGADPEKIIGILKSSVHIFGAVMKYRDLQDLANFVSYGQVDMDAMIDPRTGAARGDAVRGAAHYRSMCAGCHGLEGRYVGKRFVGRLTREDPWHAMHNILNGHPDDNMPALREVDPKVVGDILAHMQTLKERP
jgi:mono/diheme cytochrome c family protein